MSITAMKQALEALEEGVQGTRPLGVATLEAITDLRQALSEVQLSVNENSHAIEQAQEQEPVAWMHVQGNHEEPSFHELDDEEISRGWKQYPLYTTPQQPQVRTGNCLRVGVCASEGHKIQPKREWVGLTADECVAIGVATGLKQTAIYMIEAKLRSKNEC